MKPDGYDELPFAQVQVTHGFPNVGDQSLAVFIDGKPVARLPATRVAFEQDYGGGFGHVTLTLIAGDCQVIASRPDNRTHA
jgi:hypothetical protein